MIIANKLSIASFIIVLFCYGILFYTYPKNCENQKELKKDYYNQTSVSGLQHFKENSSAVVFPNNDIKVSANIETSIETIILESERIIERVTKEHGNIANIKTEEVKSINRWDITLTLEEKDLLARILWNEARGEVLEGQYAVVEVVFNRMKSNKYSSDLTEVLSQKSQFSSWKLKDIPIKRNSNYSKQLEIVEYVLDGKTNVVPMDVLYFAQTPITNNIYKKIGCHYFCKEEIK